MKNSLKGLVLVSSLMLTSTFMLSACNTVEGTAQGAGKDIQAAANVVTPKSEHKVYKHKHKHHKKMMKTKPAVSADQSTTDQTTQTTTTTETNKAE